MKRLSLSLMAICVSLFMMAQTPQAVKYQSVVRDNNGALIVQGPANFRISVLEGGSSGTPVYVETHDTFTNEFGLVTFDIGGGTVVSGDFTTINWGGNIFFFQVELDATGGTNYEVMGTSQALSVPYALHARTADQVANAPWESNADQIYNTNTGNVGVGTNSPYGKFQVDGVNSSFRVYDFPEGGDNTALGAEFRGLTYQPVLRFAGETTSEFWDIGMNGTDGFRIASSQGEAIAITPDHRVGLGTAAPFNKLEVHGNSDAHVALFRNSNNAGSSSIIFSDDTGGEKLYVGYANTGYSSNYNGLSYINSGPGLVLSTQNAERMRILETGEVGIGTTTPEALLHVAGTVKIADGTEGDGKVLTSNATGGATWQSSAALAYGLIDGINYLVAAGSYGVESVSHTSTGNYDVVLTTTGINAINAPIACTLVDTNFYGFISYYQSGSNTVSVRIRDASGADADASFSMVVFGNF